MTVLKQTLDQNFNICLDRLQPPGGVKTLGVRETEKDEIVSRICHMPMKFKMENTSNVIKDLNRPRES